VGRTTSSARALRGRGDPGNIIGNPLKRRISSRLIFDGTLDRFGSICGVRMPAAIRRPISTDGCGLRRGERQLR
jgi:hypothetical protein